MVIGFAALALIFGCLTVLGLRFLGCGWWSLLGIFTGGYLAVLWIYMAQKLRALKRGDG